LVVNAYSTKDWTAARTGTASELLERPYLVIVLRIEVPKKSGKRIVNVALLRALIIWALSNPRSMEATPTPELTTNSSAARVAAWTAGFVATEAARPVAAGPIPVILAFYCRCVRVVQCCNALCWALYGRLA